MIGESGEADLNDDATQNDRIGESKQFPNGEQEEEEDQVEEEEDLPPIFSLSLSLSLQLIRFCEIGVCQCSPKALSSTCFSRIEFLPGVLNLAISPPIMTF